MAMKFESYKTLHSKLEKLVIAALSDNDYSEAYLEEWREKIDEPSALTLLDSQNLERVAAEMGVDVSELKSYLKVNSAINKYDTPAQLSERRPPSF